MLDQVEQDQWFTDLLAAALEDAEARRSIQKAVLWAHSMSLIAEQFTDNDERDYQEQTA
jgi:hypothetical protein